MVLRGVWRGCGGGVKPPTALTGPHKSPPPHFLYYHYHPPYPHPHPNFLPPLSPPRPPPPPPTSRVHSQRPSSPFLSHLLVRSPSYTPYPTPSPSRPPATLVCESFYPLSSRPRLFGVLRRSLAPLTVGDSESAER